MHNNILINNLESVYIGFAIHENVSYGFFFFTDLKNNLSIVKENILEI